MVQENFKRAAGKAYAEPEELIRAAESGNKTSALPKGGGKAADAAVVQQFLEAAGGNKDQARKALTDSGWTIPKAN
jgi:hypothetical protein